VSQEGEEENSSALSQKVGHRREKDKAGWWGGGCEPPKRSFWLFTGVEIELGPDSAKYSMAFKGDFGHGATETEKGAVPSNFFVGVGKAKRMPSGGGQKAPPISKLQSESKKGRGGIGCGECIKYRNQ